MEADILNQEILLNINSGFCKREWCEKETSANQQPLSQKELIKKMCWDGLLAEMLPEITAKLNNKPLVLWEIFETNQLLHLRLGEYKDFSEAAFSLNPYKILYDFNCN